MATILPSPSRSCSTTGWSGRSCSRRRDLEPGQRGRLEVGDRRPGGVRRDGRGGGGSSWNGVAAPAADCPSTGGRRGRGRRPVGGGGGVGRRGRRGGGEDLVDVAGDRLEDGPEPELGRVAHELQGPLLVLDAGQLHDHRPPLPGDVGLRHAEGIDAVADDLDGLVQGVVADVRGRLEHHGHPALEVEAQLRGGAGAEDGSESTDGHEDDEDEGGDLLATHARGDVTRMPRPSGTAGRRACRPRWPPGRLPRAGGSTRRCGG